MSSKFIKLISSALILLSLLILFFITFNLFQSKNEIGIEIIAPSLLSEKGHKIQDSIQDHVAIKYLENNVNQKIFNDQAKLDESFIKNILSFLDADDRNNKAEWILQNNLSVGSLSEYRGFYLHHYQTILFPLREVKNGNYYEILTSQYGAASIIPAIIIGNKSFIWYPGISIILLMLGIATIFLKKIADPGLIIISLLVFLIALCENIGALKLSPGFSIFRIFPTWLLIYISSKSILKESVKNGAFLAFIVSILNSLQINLLIAIINLCTLLYLKWQKERNSNILKITLAIFLAFILQSVLYLTLSDDFSQKLFSSLEGGSKNYLYIELIFLFPSAVFMAKRFLFKKEETSLDIYCYLAYFGLSTYPIAFPGSPQHFCSFLILSSLPIYILASSVSKNKLLGALFLVPLYFTAYHYSYLNLPKPMGANTPSIFNSNEFGSQLIFSTPSNIEAVHKKYLALINNYSPEENIINLTSDAKYFSAITGKNPPQKNYDLYIYTPNLKINSNDFKGKLEKNNIKWIVIYNPFFLKNFQKYLEYKISITTEPSVKFELKQHLMILKEQLVLSKNPLYKLKECSDRYCLYQL